MVRYLAQGLFEQFHAHTRKRLSLVVRDRIGSACLAICGFSSFYKTFENSTTFFRKVSSFTDPYEGSIPHSLMKIRQRDAGASGIPSEEMTIDPIDHII